MPFLKIKKKKTKNSGSLTHGSSVQRSTISKNIKYISETVYFYDISRIKEQVQNSQITYPSGF